MRYEFTIITENQPFQTSQSVKEPRKRGLGKTLARILTLILIPLLIISIGMFLLYPHYNDIVLAKESLNARNISNSASLNFFTSISPRLAQEAYEDDFDNELAMEYIDPKVLAQYANEGEISSKLEDDHTKMSIKSANIEANLIDGENAYAMEKGPWHFPLSEGPGEKGNFVIIGHRFAELPPSTNTFFNLDKIDVGDKVTISQNGGIEYSYTVVETKVVDKNDRSILSDYGDYRITLVTCTPLWTSKQRLVVTAILDRAYHRI